MFAGETQPVQNLTTDSLRFLNNDQSAADSAYFMANVKFDGIDEDLTAPGTPWIYYGVRTFRGLLRLPSDAYATLGLLRRRSLRAHAGALPRSGLRCDSVQR